MSNSPLVTYTKISPNKNHPRARKIDTITIHCVVGQLSVQTLGNMFSQPALKTSANYGIGVDGQIGLFVPEEDRSWCSSNSSNDHRAITIEVASDRTEPYAVNEKAYASLINLLVDICERNGIKKLLWKGDKSLIGKVNEQNMTVHRWFANKSCPGTYLYNKHPEIAAEVNKRLGVVVSDTKPTQTPVDKTYKVSVTIDDLNIRKGPGTSYAVTGQTGKGVFTIVEEKYGWGKLKSGAGWINLKYTKRI